MFSVTIDRENCVSCGMCWNTCPAVYEQNAEDSKSQVVAGLQTAGIQQKEMSEPIWPNARAKVRMFARSA